jgi:site-specific recombinase XerD
MLLISANLKWQFEKFLAIKKIPKSKYWGYIDSLRAYINFCKKAGFSSNQKENLPRFLLDLEYRKQTKIRQTRAEASISLYYDFLNYMNNTDSEPESQSLNKKSEREKVC